MPAIDMAAKFLVLGIFCTSAVGVAIIRNELRQCEKIREPMCTESVPYNETVYPNMLGHPSQSNSGMDREAVYRMLQFGCSEQLRLFACLVYVPPCSGIKACRSLCKKVRDECTAVRELLGFDWFDDLQCDNRFPENHCMVEDGVIKEATSWCEPIDVPMCTGLYYNTTQFPNAFFHRSQREANKALEMYEPLYSMCSPSHTDILRLFICSVYVQTCPFSIPCRNLCVMAHNSCSHVPFHFPENLACNNFPDIDCMDEKGEIITGRLRHASPN